MDLDAEYSEYKAYIEEFAKTIDPNDQLPLRVSGYCLRDFEIHGEILDWLMSYLGRVCPITLRMYLIQTAIKRTLEKVKEVPVECGFDAQRNVYQPLKLVKVVVSIVNTLILDLQDNAKLYEVPLPPTSPAATEMTKVKQPPKYSVDAIKNSRRTMEDKHMIIDDFNGYFNTQDTEPTFYYGIFDGHSGSDAASYANSHLNYNIAVHPKYPSDIETAMREAFLVTDISFLKKAKAENLNSGTTALCAMYRKTEKKLYIGWCGDSQALIARVGNVRQIVKKHSPEDKDERNRIEKLGGVVLYWGNSYRVNGALAVSRAIGDKDHKPFVSAEPEIECIHLDGEEDFIVLGCDGLWDNLSEDDVAITVYKKIRENPDNYRTIASDLCSLAKSQGSRDNISVIVVYLKEPQLIAKQSWPSTIEPTKDIMENLNMYEEPPVANPVTMDALGNTNQDMYNNPFDDFNNQLISDVAIGKSTEITDLVMQQQPENASFNLTDTMTNTLNNINNNKFNNGHEENNFNMDDVEMKPDQPQPVMEQNEIVLNDTNNNSNNNLGGTEGPETDVDAIDEDFQFNAAGATGGFKERTQMEFKETEDVADRANIMIFGEDHSAAMYGTLENKIFEEMSLQNPDLKGNNPFASDDAELAAFAPVEEFLDNKMMEQEMPQEIQQHVDDFEEQMQSFASGAVDRALDFISEGAVGAEDESMGANAEEAIEHQQPEADLGFVGSTQQAIGESGGEDSEDEWNYVKVDKKQSDGLAAVEETSEAIPESPVVDKSVHFEAEQDFEPLQQGEIETNLAESDQHEFVEHHQTIESHLTESEKDFEQEKEPALFEEEKQAQDDIKKDLELTVDTEEFDEMSQLNPEAKVFVPVSPTRSNGPLSPTFSDIMNPTMNSLVVQDAVVAQSPRKGESMMEEDISLPTEKDFDNEAESRPHEINAFENGAFPHVESPERLNLKESMQQDDKLEQEYKDEAAQPFFEEVKQQAGEEYKVLESSFSEYSNGFQSAIDPMNRSFYEGRDDGDILTAAVERTSDVLNSVQPIPTFEDDAFDLGASGDFVAEQFVEEIKNASVEQDKYIDQGLSPTLPNFNLGATIPEMVHDAFVTASAPVFEEPHHIEIIPTETKGASEPPSTPEPDVQEPVLSPETLEPEVKEEPKVEAVEIATGTAAVAVAAIVGVAATKKAIGSKTEVKKTDAKAKVPAASKANPVPAKRLPASTSSSAPKTATARPASASAATVTTSAKPLAARKVATTLAAKSAPKLVSSAPASRPKAPASTVPAAKKPLSGSLPKPATDTAAKPAPITRPSATAPKKPLAAVPASKPLVRPTTAAAPSKPKLTNGVVTERKPLVSSASTTRAATKPTSLATTAKPKVNGPAASSTLSTRTTTKTTTSARLSVSAAEKSATSPIKEKVQNRSLGSASTTRSPRPTTTVTATKPSVKDLKSPATTKPSPSLGAVGVKKPLSTVKKSPLQATTTTTVTKKSPTKVTAVKKTTTTVVQKKVVNGGIVTEETTTTETTSGDPQLIEDILKDGLASELNGHFNGHGLAENGAGEQASHMVLDSAAD